MAKRIETELRKKIRRQYELGEDLLSLAIKYKLNYGTLKNIASKENWIRNGALKLQRLKELFEDSEKLLELKRKVKEEYQEMTASMRTILLEADEPKFKATEEAIKNRAQAIKELYGIDKELHGLYTEPEIERMKLDILKIEQLKELLETKNYDITDPEFITEMLKKLPEEKLLEIIGKL